MGFIGKLIAGFLVKTSGLKTYVGLLGALLAFLLGPDVSAVLPPHIHDIVMKISEFLIGLGLTHKADKAIAAISTKDDVAPASVVPIPVQPASTSTGFGAPAPPNPLTNH